jgi:Fe-S-cluster-containing dehydrogenase component
VVNKYRVNGKEVFCKTQCNHCLDPACAAACFVKAFQKDPSGAVTYDGDLCVGCRYCMIACPFNIPGFQYCETWAYVRKCTLCLPRLKEGKLPGCVQECPMDALTFGKRADLLKLAKTRIDARPDVYQHHVYGETEAGGTNWMYLSGAPFSQVGLDENVIKRPYAELTSGALGAVPMVIGLWPMLFGGAYMISSRRFYKRRETLAQEELHAAAEKARAEVREATDRRIAEAEAANQAKLAQVEAEAAKKVAAAEEAAAASAAKPAAAKQGAKGAKKSAGEDA